MFPRRATHFIRLTLADGNDLLVNSAAAIVTIEGVVTGLAGKQATRVTIVATNSHGAGIYTVQHVVKEPPRDVIAAIAAFEAWQEAWDTALSAAEDLDLAASLRRAPTLQTPLTPPRAPGPWNPFGDDGDAS